MYNHSETAHQFIELSSVSLRVSSNFRLVLFTCEATHQSVLPSIPASKKTGCGFKEVVFKFCVGPSFMKGLHQQAAS